MSAADAKPAWSLYEQQVSDLIEEHFREAEIRRNVRIKGRFSKRKRQVDILIEEKTAAGPLITVVDTKLFKRKVDVKCVDAFAGFVDDVGAQRGMLITERGYTNAALRRAFYGPADLEVDILSFAELQKFQGFAAIPYSGEHGFLVPAPYGWVVDGTQGRGFVASMYPRGVDFEGARARKEFIYLNFWHRDRKKRFSAVELDEQQVACLRRSGPVTVTHRPTIQRNDAKTRLRIADVKRYKCLEITGFLEFENVVLFAVLLTPSEKQRPNLRRLEAVLRQAKHIDVTHNNSREIRRIQSELESVVIPSDRARLLGQIGHLFREEGNLPDARKYLEESLSLDSSQYAYPTVRELLAVLSKQDDTQRAMEVMALLVRLDPHNPTVFNDCFEVGADWIKRTELLNLFDRLKKERPEDRLTQAGCDFYAANLLMYDDVDHARRRLVSARKTFRNFFPRDHHVFRGLRRGLKFCSGAMKNRSGAAAPQTLRNP